ncbi:TPA: phage holin family protein [Streptococcus suis]|uniref:phage holin family protein n=1 Tax=Streptococcus suis TaxID=1307 RepID=UPI002A7E655A|nr:phage holin family protein [Streptococcus suis]HEL1739382.1 phage holin family protein [Streptococcus suis]HEL2045648.1 phage holin family protein [Streptococcus suis]HEL2171796.1 phage holin family protein [Streptococcus suis]HEL2302462.1 phage holin family protein [Streptococcus suis]
MRELLTANKVLFSTIGGIIGSIFGELDGFLYALLVFMVIDYLTGIMAAILEKNLSSSIGKKGIFKKVMIIFLVAMAHMLDLHVVKQGGAVRTAVIFFYFSNEGLSILENATRLGLPIPNRIRNVLRQLQEEHKEDL